MGQFTPGRVSKTLEPVGAVRQWRLPEMQTPVIDPIMASYAYMSKDQMQQPHLQQSLLQPQLQQ